MLRNASHKSVAAAFAAFLISGAFSAPSRADDYTYSTNFAKDNNIYTNLNQQFPHTGTGTPGSGMGTPNATYFFDPPPTGSTNLQNDVNNGVGFQLSSDAAGHDFASVGGVPLVVPIGVQDATHVFALVGAYNGVTASATFVGDAGATQTFSNFFIPDFNGGSINSTSPTFNDQTVFQVQDVGAGGTGNSSNGAYNNYSLTELGFVLGPQFQGQSLQSVTFSSNGFETLVLGVTTAASSQSVSAAPEPGAWALMLAGVGVLGALLRRRGFAAAPTALRQAPA